MSDYELARFNMVESQVKPNNVTDVRILNAFLAVPRELFVPSSRQAVAYSDEDQPLGRGRYLGAPMVVARMIRFGQIGKDDLVLHVGAGTGYLSVVMAKLANAVVALEEDEDLAARAEGLLDEEGGDNVVVKTGPLTDGWSEQAPYDVILIEGGVETIPQPLEDQLAEGGRLLAVRMKNPHVGSVVLRQKSGGMISERALFDAWLPLLPGFRRAPEFVF